MKRLKQIYACDYFVILVLAIIFILRQKFYIVLFASFYLIIFKNSRNFLLYLTLIFLIFIRILAFNSLNHYYYINKLDNNYLTAVSLSNKIKIYNQSQLEYGDLIKINVNDYEDLKSINDFKNAYRYKVYASDIVWVFKTKSLRKTLFNKIRMNDNLLKAVLNKEFFKIYSDDYGDNYLLNNISWSIFYLSLIKFVNHFIKKRLNSIILVSLFLFSFIGLSYTSFRLLIIELLLYFIPIRINALSIAAIVMLLINPYSIYSYSFILAFIIRFNFSINSILKFNSLLILMQSFFFGEINLIYNYFFRQFSIIKAVLIIALAIFYLFNFNLRIIDLKLLDDCFEIIKAISIRSKISVTLIIVLLYLFKKYQIKNSFLQCFCICLILLSNLSNLFAKVGFIDVGQGDAILIKSAFNSETILIDTGSEFNYYKLKRYLIKNGVYNIDRLVITHGDSDHYGNLKNICKDFIVDEYVYAHDDVKLDHLELKCLSKDAYKSKNDNSLVHYLQIDNLKFLFTGDISKQVERDIAEIYPLDIDVLKLAHHGSDTSTSFELLNQMKPEIGIISTNGRYNHPAKSVIKSLNDYQIKYFSTKESGDIEFIFTSFLKFIKCSNGDFVIIDT